MRSNQSILEQCKMTAQVKTFSMLI